MPIPENQTQFGQTQPLYEQPVILPLSEAEQEMQKKKKKLLLIGVGLLLFMIGSVALAKLLMPAPTIEKTPGYVESPTPTPILDLSLRGRIQAARTELEFIGQTEYQLPLPQVDWNIRLEDKKQ